MHKRLAVFLALLVAAAADARAVTIDWVPVGNPGNAADTTVMMSDGTTGYGSVGYAYNIGKYDVTNAQYAEFLNTKDPTGANALGLWNVQMQNPPDGGITLNAGNVNGTKYTVVAGNQNHPVTFETWYSALRFANWLNNGQGNGNTETGAYTLGPLGAGGEPINGDAITRNAGARVFLPSESEWYKAAYYNPATNSYFTYPTSSSSPPIGSSPTGLANHANTYPGGPLIPTDVGAYTGTTSPYGAFDMGGNVFQWNDTLVPTRFFGLNPGWRGGGSIQPSDFMLSSYRGYDYPSAVDGESGFRLAETPEPSSLVLAALGFIGLAAWRLRRR